jgi:hypothetical protein
MEGDDRDVGSLVLVRRQVTGQVNWVEDINKTQ